MDRPDPDRERMKLVQEAYERSRRTYGYRRIPDLDRERIWNQNQPQSSAQIDEEAQYSLCGQAKEPIRLINNRYDAVHNYPNLLTKTSTVPSRTKNGVQILPTFELNRDLSTWPSSRISLMGRSGACTIKKQLHSDGVASCSHAAADLQSQTGVIIQSDQGAQFQSSAYRPLTARWESSLPCPEKGIAWTMRQLRISSLI